MKRAEVGRFRVMLDDRGEGAVVIDHAEPEARGNKTMLLEPGELADLLVAIDGVSNDLRPPPDDRPAVDKIRDIMQEAAHKLYVLGFRHRVEIHVETTVLYDLANEGDRKIEHPRPDTATIDLNGPYVRLVAQRGRRV